MREMPTLEGRVMAVEVSALNDGQCGCRWRVGTAGELAEQLEECAYHIGIRERAAQAEETEKWRSAARVLCGAHVGVPQTTCPVCALAAQAERIAALVSAIIGAAYCLKPTGASDRPDPEQAHQILMAALAGKAGQA